MDLTLAPIKRPRITTMVLNNTVDRNAAITQLIEAVNEVGSELNQSNMHNINSHSPPAARQQKVPAPIEPSIAKRMRAEEDTEEEEETKREAEEEAAPTKQTETEKTI